MEKIDASNSRQGQHILYITNWKQQNIRNSHILKHLIWFFTVFHICICFINVANNLKVHNLVFSLLHYAWILCFMLDILCNIWYSIGTAPTAVLLTHWSQVLHACVNILTIIGSDNGLSSGQRQAIIWTNVGILLNGHLGTNFSEIRMKKNFIQEKTFENVVYEWWSLSRLQCVNTKYTSLHNQSTWHFYFFVTLFSYYVIDGNEKNYGVFFVFFFFLFQQQYMYINIQECTNNK